MEIKRLCPCCKIAIATGCCMLLSAWLHVSAYAQQEATGLPALKPDTRIEPIHPIWTKNILQFSDTIRIVFIGDIMQHGSQIRSAHIKGKDPAKASSYDYSHAFQYFSNRFKKADLAVANMEFPMGILPYSGYPQFSAPVSIAIEAKNSGIGLFQLANNHLLDKGKAGIERTLHLYDSLGVPYTGAYSNSTDEQEKNPKILELKGVKIAFINFTYGTNGYPVPAPFIISRMDSTRIKEAIQKAKEKGAQMIVALPHWGNEYELYPSEVQKAWAKMLFNNGVKIIIGTHPHVPQVAELYPNQMAPPRRKGELNQMIFYSLGNYISNQSIPDYSQLGLLVEVKIVKNNLNGELSLIHPDYEFIWCFKKDEFKRDYTVVPVKDFLNKEDQVKNKTQYKRMVDTYHFIMGKKLIKEIY